MRYGIYFVDADDLNVDADDLSFNDVKELANDFWQGNDTYELSIALIKAINNDEINTENGFIFMVDLLEETILN